MKELNFTTEELKNTIKGNYIASGSEASIYKYKKFIALRLYDVDNSIYCMATGEKIGKPKCEKMINDLLLYKDNVSKTSFPLGIVKENGIVVGQIVKFYDNSQTLTDFFKENKDIDPIPYYFKILDILEELTQNNICYEDVHGGNFLVVNDKIRIIDFSDHRVKVNENFGEMYYPMFQNFGSMVNNLNFKVLNKEDEYERLIIPQEIKKDTTHLKEDFNYIKEQLLSLKKHTKTK